MGETLTVLLVMACLTLATYNCHGLGPGRLEYINKLAETNDFLFLQEHWMFSEQINVFESKVKDMHVHGVSGMPEHELIAGRPYGGCAILWRRSLRCKVSPVVTESKRMCIIRVSDDSGLDLLMCNVYMPCDTEHDVSTAEVYGDILNEITQIAENTNCEKIIVGGDFNTDFRRTRSLNTNALVTFMHNEFLKCGEDFISSRIDYSYESKANGHQSLIDHFLVTNNLFEDINRYEALHDGDNLSDHSAVCMSFDLLTSSEEIKTGQPVSVPCWNRATLENIHDYQTTLDHLLDSIVMPWEAIQCSNYSCEQHSSMIQTLHDDIIKACLTAGDSSIPRSINRGCTKKAVPGWNENVRVLRSQAIFWHCLWKDNNSPREGLLADIRRTTRFRYHHALKTVKHNKDKLVANKMAENLLNKNTRDFWSGVRKMKGSNKTSPSTVDGETGAENIANVFGDNCITLFRITPNK